MSIKNEMCGWLQKLSVGASVMMGGAVVSAMAQETASGTWGDPRDLRNDSTVRVGYTLDAPIYKGDTELGDLSTLQTTLRHVATVRVDERWRYRVGLEWNRFSLSTPANSPFPNTLQSISVPLGFDYQWNERWSARFQVKPGLYSDFRDIDLRDVQAPVTAGVMYRMNDTLTWLFQVNVQPQREIPVIGGVGVIWRISEDWRLSLILPEPRIEYLLTDQVTLYAGGAITGEAYAVGEKYGTEIGDPALNDEFVSYREIRAVGGVRWAVDRRWRVDVEAGYTIDRRLVYDDVRRLYNGDGAPYLGTVVNFSF